MSLSSSSLRYRVVEGPVELASLRVLESRAFAWGEMKVTVSILGASHAVSIDVGGTSITELLTCAGPGGGSLLAESGIRADVCVVAHGIICRASIRPHSIGPAAELKGRFGTDSILQAVFPGAAGVAEPVTRLGWNTGSDSMVVETIHTYPEEGIVVRSETHFEIEQGA